eukprot:TRINITY_DN11209_c0_g1_i2.p1 TRINITY_DN11209_c0_g1~~TRINITY_DN11209_c0_g1_i2.p1  ORF type:complete len:102 (+),score=2.55 TRINITY_DN11209_c0_g1_i2:2371-2676(+)
MTNMTNHAKQPTHVISKNRHEPKMSRRQLNKRSPVHTKNTAAKSRCSRFQQNLMPRNYGCLGILSKQESYYLYKKPTKKGELRTIVLCRHAFVQNDDKHRP